ncbi:heavy-metal-associated domain-containing protein [[Mycobacterium] holstebronense]|uniref:Cation transporter n=1 Tax=[Mycobacterium] holstebronense TaxID=3064288 RepID=A0ABM9M4N0_9MYCO|nr:cation transporter [Mycolicibacter sp. MU0102]CAJ1510103.1 cation transporter [Mycolicibacter sp. MU0102]
MSDIRRIQLDVTGMTCRMCSAHIELKLNSIDGVRASVDFPSATATIDADSAVSVAALCAAIADAGYQGELRWERPRTAEDLKIPGGPIKRIARLTRLLSRGRRMQEAGIQTPDAATPIR